MNLLRLLWRINELTMNYYYIATRLLANFQHFSTKNGMICAICTIIKRHRISECKPGERTIRESENYRCKKGQRIQRNLIFRRLNALPPLPSPPFERRNIKDDVWPFATHKGA